jgi:gluconokinase
MTRIVVMGVSGSGKSTVGRLLAERLGVAFVEGDELHPPRNVALMAAGTPLTDADREGWLQAIATQLRDAYRHGRGLVVACSALRRRYRDLLRSGAPDTVFVLLHGERRLLAERLQDRKGHYMPASLLQSQLDTLEPPQPDERALTHDIADPPVQIVAAVLERLEALGATP